MSNTPESQISSEKWLDVVRAKVGLIRYGSVLITVHDGRVTQVELMERTRIGTDEAEVVRADGKPVARHVVPPRSGGGQSKP